MEAAGGDVALEPDQATATHILISYCMLPPLQWPVKPPFYLYNDHGSK